MYTQHTTWEFRWACNAIVRLSFSLRSLIPRSHLIFIPSCRSILFYLTYGGQFSIAKKCNLTLPIQTQVENGAHVISSCKLESSFVPLTSSNQIMALVVRYRLGIFLYLNPIPLTLFFDL